jgi:hypothetical protein
MKILNLDKIKNIRGGKSFSKDKLLINLSKIERFDLYEESKKMIKLKNNPNPIYSFLEEILDFWSLYLKIV